MSKTIIYDQVETRRLSMFGAVHASMTRGMRVNGPKRVSPRNIFPSFVWKMREVFSPILSQILSVVVATWFMVLLMSASQRSKVFCIGVSFTLA